MIGFLLALARWRWLLQLAAEEVWVRWHNRRVRDDDRAAYRAGFTDGRAFERGTTPTTLPEDREAGL